MGNQIPGGFALIPLATILLDLTRVHEALEARPEADCRFPADGDDRLIDQVRIVWANEEFGKAFGLGEESISPAALHAFGASGGLDAFNSMLTGFRADADYVDAEVRSEERRVGKEC